MYWGNHVRILFTVTLVWQAVHLGKGCEKEELEENVKSLNATAEKQQPKNEGTTINSFSDMNQSYESRKEQNSLAVVPFTGITESKKLNRHCCQNGGTCILGAFCACQKHFTGRYCEHDERQSNCGSIAHGTWVLKGCWLCRCGYGTLNCLSEIMHGNCELKSENEDITSQFSNGLRIQQTVFALACLLTIVLELCCWQL
ncbi:cryptic protein-like isoform X1 [Pezoporus wallicus]|uniref:cryptic protein-like isoform X1 n=1 Tax=Pezoporus wallicus TaxID=35540 RepID=UPI0025502E4B|nr:cryptic protein-like isoform X1 [Pezoporus wallicus]